MLHEALGAINTKKKKTASKLYNKIKSSCCGSKETCLSLDNLESVIYTNNEKIQLISETNGI